MAIDLDRPLLSEQFARLPLESATADLGCPDALRARAARTGYLFLPGALSEAEVVPVRRFVRSWCERHGWAEPVDGDPPYLPARAGARLTGHGWDDPRWVELQREMRLLPAFRALATSPIVLEPLRLVIGEEVQVATANYCWLKLPGSPAQTTRPHQDICYLRQEPRLWTAWVPLVDTPDEVGPLAVVPGSNRGGELPHVSPIEGIDMPSTTAWATGRFQPGDVVLFDAMTIHCAWSNMSDTRIRASIDIRYEPRGDGAPTALTPM